VVGYRELGELVVYHARPHRILPGCLGSLDCLGCPDSAWGLVQFYHERRLADYAPDFLLERDDGS
jgi:hypothetical protein